MIEGLKCLIKISLAILNFLHNKLQDDSFNPFSRSEFIDILKNFSDDIKPESHLLLSQACTYKVTSKLMHDMQKLYVKENNKPTQR